MYNLTTEEVFDEVKSSRAGLQSKEAKNRLIEYGENKVEFNNRKPLGKKITHELNQIVMFVLLFALVSNIVAVVLTNDLVQLINIALIFVIMVLNVSIGVSTTSKMERTLVRIKKAIPSTSRVRRSGKVVQVRSEELVVGDVVYLSAGDIVPADVRLIDTANLRIVDTVITGQTMAIEKTCDVIDGKYMPLGDRNNMAYMGSSVVSGTGVGVVVATGKDTELGKTQNLLSEEVKITTPLVRKLYKYIEVLSYFVLVMSVVSFLINIIFKRDIADSFMVAVSLAVCVVPESLIISIYSTLSRGIKDLSRQNLLVKDLASIEKLGSVDVVCVDKEKVLTLNTKTVTDVWVGNMDEYELVDNPNFATMMNCMLLCNSSTLELDGDRISVRGDGYEKALVEYALANGFNKDNLQGVFPQVNIFPFDSYRKMMTTLNSVGDETYAFTKGDFNQVFNRCTHLLIDGKNLKLTDADKQYILSKFNDLKDKGMSVMGFATKEVSGNIYELTGEQVEKDMSFVGLCGVYDPAKTDTKEVLKSLSRMDVRVVMLTPDDKESAFMIAKSLGICKSFKQVITGQEIDMMTDVELHKRIDEFSVFSRLLNGQKLRIVKALQQENVVAVTGDNAEDLSAMSQADVGIGLARTGCEVVKQSSNILTKDDSLNSIKEGIKVSRRIQLNISKMITYLVSAGVTQLLLMSIIVVGLRREFFSPALILWLNFVNGLIPCFALGCETNKNVMLTKPRKDIFNRKMIVDTIAYGIMKCVIILVLYFAGLESFYLDNGVVVSMCFVTLAFMEIFNAYNIKNGSKSIFSSNPFNNKLLNIGFAVSVVATIAFAGLSFTVLQSALGTTSITIVQWLICFGVSALIVPLGEMWKLIKKL